jgi:23S rRNA (uridine2552-2'-O)-methyltransferase
MKDHYTVKAKSQGLRARSAYKLLQLNQKYNLIKKGDDVLDLGCWPGGWLVASQRISKTGRVLGIDLTRIKPIEGVEFIQEDINKVKLEGKFDIVMSDMAPKTTGIHAMDVGRSIDLAEMALKFAKKHLKENGNFLVKVFQGEGFDDYYKKVKKYFKFAKTTKPEASRKRSKEVYIVGFKFQNLHKS